MAQIPGQQSTPTTSQSSTSQQYEHCLLVTRHKLLQQQEEDLARICQKVTRVDSLPTDLNELKKLVDFYSAVIGIIPLPIQVQILQLKKPVLLFEMISLGTTKTREEAEDLLAKSKKEGIILPPVREGEPYRVSAYRGIILVKEIRVVDEPVIQHW